MKPFFCFFLKVFCTLLQFIKCLYLYLNSGKSKKKKMAYIKIENRNLKFEDVTIITSKGKFSKSVREDRVAQYKADFILFNDLKGKPYLIKST